MSGDNQRVAIVLLADTETAGDMGRMANALTAVQEFAEAGDDVKLIFDGAGVKWPGVLQQKDHDYHDLFKSVKLQIAGACGYCADAFGESDAVASAEIDVADEYQGHPSFRSLVSEGYEVITF